MASLNKKLDALVDQFTPVIAEAFRASIQDVTDRAILKDVIKAIELGDPIQAFRALGFSDAAMRPLNKAIEDAFEAGGITTSQAFPSRLNTPNGAIVFRFDIRASRAEKWIREKSGSLITNVSSDILGNIRNVMFDGLRDGLNPKTVALDIVGRYDKQVGHRVGGVVGLNGPQERAVANMRRDLVNLDENYFTRTRRDMRFDGVIRKMFDQGRVDQDTITKMTTRYKDSLLKLRGDTIGRDGAIEALNTAQYEAIAQANDQGAIKNTRKVWDSSGNDGRTRDDHLQLESTTRAKPLQLNEPFVFPDGTRALYPQDRSLGASAAQTINCRCRVEYVIDWLADVV